jgi:uncharacterized protein (UPF0332 family)
LRKIPPSQQKATQSIRKAQQWLRESKNSLKARACGSSIIASYMAMFHGARAILYRDGFREKSHYCIARYLEERYVKANKLDKKWIQLLDYAREIRHEDQYNLSFFSSKEEAERAIKVVEGFLLQMKDLLSI